MLMIEWTDDQIVATRDLYQTLYQLGLVTPLGVYMVVGDLDNILRLRHGIFS
jgi:hypothetical protein